MFLDFIEIGTSDFDTEIQKDDNKSGLSIEPVQYYIDKLPNKPNCQKLNIGISNINGTANVYYIPEDIIVKHNLAPWYKGCNSINHYHPTVANDFRQLGLNIKEMVTSYTVPIKTLMTVINEQNITGIHYLKIDTEGHDTVILNQFYKDITDNIYLPHKILFESNVLSNNRDVINIINMYGNKGYELISRNSDDTILKLNLQKIPNKTKFTDSIPKYYITVVESSVKYDVNNLPYNNTLEDAKKYCIEHNYSGITYENGIYQVKNGTYTEYVDDTNVMSWIYL
jgi:FkbM family methyltransferase